MPGKQEKSREHGVIHEHSVRRVGMTPEHTRLVVREEEDLRYPLQASSLEPPVVRVEVDTASSATLSNGLGANWSPAGQGEEAFPEETDEEGWQRVLDGMTYHGYAALMRAHKPGAAIHRGATVPSDVRLFRGRGRRTTTSTILGSALAHL